MKLTIFVFACLNVYGAIAELNVLDVRDPLITNMASYAVENLGDMYKLEEITEASLKVSGVYDIRTTVLKTLRDGIIIREACMFTVMDDTKAGSPLSVQFFQCTAL